jgi:pantothenate kinase type III
VRLLADCGNTTLKLGIADGSAIVVHARLPATRDSLVQFHAMHGGGVRELILLPGNRRHGDLVRAWWAELVPNGLLRVIGEDLLLPDYGQYATCGYDRVLAGAVTCLKEQRSLVVLDAGTATTITAWHCELGLPRFAGGLILPGAQACLDGLTAAAPALPKVAPFGPAASAVQKDTMGSMAAAVGIGYGPMVAACLLKLERETGIHEVVATGGNIQLIVESRILPPSAHRPALVLSGMAYLADHMGVGRSAGH